MTSPRKLIRYACSVLALVCAVQGTVAAPASRSHRVTRGENLSTIAQRYGVTVRQLRDANGISGDRILIGQRLSIPGEDGEWYVVRRGDSLSRIATAHGTTVGELRRLNDLRRTTIYPGQRLRLRAANVDAAFHVVRSGDILSRIARDHGTTVASLKRINGLSSDRIYPGQKLRLRESERSIHLVERGDALWEIAKAYGLTVAELKQLNGLTSNRIYPGQELRVTGTATAAPRLADYTVRVGDNLTEIAQLHQMSLRELRDLNEIRGSLIHPGQVLRVRPLLGRDTTTADGPEDWDALLISLSGVQRIEAANGPYYHVSPRAAAQRSRTYVEESRVNPRSSYSRARTLWNEFAAAVDAMPRRSDRLAGWHFVLDPGHGGIDPGAIVAGTAPDGSSFHVVEDEYVYDVAMRVYVLLRLHGAEATLTLLSPNHLLRGNEPVSSTFVHDRNEVFNDENWNRRNRPQTWPKGNQSHLDERVAIAKRAWRNVSQNRTVFLSFHADVDKYAGGAVTLFHYEDRRRRDDRSRDFAGRLLPAMGAGARIKGRNLAVLRNNPAHFKLLVEMRNLAFQEHVWAIRHEALRQRDAEKVVRALLEGLAPGAGGGARVAGP